MGLRTIRRQMRATLLTSAHRDLFLQARTREPGLSDHLTLPAVVALLSDDKADTYPEREALLRALLREHQQHPAPLWSSLLVLAFMPMLLHLRGRLTSSAFTPEELDQLVFEIFLDEARLLPLERYATRCAMYLRQSSQRRLFREIRQQQRSGEGVVPLEEQGELAELVAQAFPWLQLDLGELPDPEDPEALLGFLQKHLGQHIPAERLALLAHTTPEGESVRDYAARLHPDLSGEELERAYQRLKRARQRTQERVRLLLSPPDEPDALPCTEASAPGARRPP
jgi:hypothetical protein